MRTRIKVCCIASLEEAEEAIHLGADAIGLVGEMPSGPGVIDDKLACAIAAGVPPPVAAFLLTSRVSGAAIADEVRACGTTAVQVVRHVAPEEHVTLMQCLPAVRRVQVIHVEDASALELIRQYEPFVHAFLLDSGRPSAAVAELGGTGRVHDWAISREVVRRAAVPVFLAGGLSAENVAQALELVRPFGVDVCSGVRTQGVLDSMKLRSFIAAVRHADARRVEGASA